MILGFVIATKYRLRHKPGYDYPDLRPLIQNLSTFAKAAYLSDGPIPQKQYNTVRQAAQFLGIPGTSSDPLKHLRKGPKYHGNLPFEVLNYISAYFQISFANGTVPVAIIQTQAMNGLSTLLECLTGMERVLNTPLPIAYNIAISQITWAYILVLPFQLVAPLGWVAIPGTLGTPLLVAGLIIAAAYIILGIAAIGREIENPFGKDVNDLDMEGYIRSLAVELEILTCLPPPKAEDFIAMDENFPLGPMSTIPYSGVKNMSVEST
jgi:ion channel-forming bestrophin family protein